jgi:diguanylate cyclase (GGDEF)-like protein
MDIKADFNRVQPANWNDKIRKAYWIICIMSFVFSLITWPFIVQDGQEAYDVFIKNNLILQHIILLGIMVLAELIYRMRTKLQDYLIIVIGAGISTTLFSLIPITVYGVQVVMLLPILISILFFSYRKVFFASLLTLTTNIALVFTLPSYHEGVPAEQYSVIIGSIMVCAFLALGIVGRGLDIMKAEERVLVEEERLIRQKLSMGQLARKDALTGLDNHRTFQEQLRYSVELSDEHELPIHLAIIDIDNFKNVNDSCGHWAGDIVLRRIGILVGEQSNENIFAARYGGEEFAVIFKRMESNAVTEWLEILYERLELTVFPEIGNLRITFSTGCHRLQPGITKEILFQCADQALYKAKMGGKDQIVWSEPVEYAS